MLDISVWEISLFPIHYPHWLQINDTCNDFVSLFHLANCFATRQLCSQKIVLQQLLHKQCINSYQRSKFINLLSNEPGGAISKRRNLDQSYAIPFLNSMFLQIKILFLPAYLKVFSVFKTVISFLFSIFCQIKSNNRSTLE